MAFGQQSNRSIEVGSRIAVNWPPLQRLGELHRQHDQRLRRFGCIIRQLEAFDATRIGVSAEQTPLRLRLRSNPLKFVHPQGVSTP